MAHQVVGAHVPVRRVSRRILAATLVVLVLMATTLWLAAHGRL